MSGSSLRIMTYNTHHSAGNDECENLPAAAGQIPGADCSLDLPRLANVINVEKPTIVGLQETDRFWARSASVDQPKEFARLLGMDVCFGANEVHEPDVHADVYHEYGVTTLSKYPISGFKNQHFPTYEGFEQRGMLDTRIDVPDVGEVAVINTHLQIGGGSHRAEATRQRIEQIQILTDHVSSLVIPTIVFGDFNTESSTGEIDSLIRSGTPLIEVWEAAGEGSGETIFNGAHGEATARIDYILVSPHFDVISAEIIDNDQSRMASDHFPLVAELGFRGL